MSTHVLNALERQYQLTLGHIRRLETAEYEWEGVEGYHEAARYWQERMKGYRRTLAALEKSIRLFDPKWERKALMVPKKTIRMRPKVETTKFQSALWRALRSSTEPLTNKEIGLRIAADLSLPISRPHQRAELFERVRATLANYRKLGFVERVEGRWSELLDVNQDDGDRSTPE